MSNTDAHRSSADVGLLVRGSRSEQATAARLIHGFIGALPSYLIKLCAVFTRGTTVECSEAAKAILDGRLLLSPEQLSIVVVRLLRVLDGRGAIERKGVVLTVLEGLDPKRFVEEVRTVYFAALAELYDEEDGKFCLRAAERLYDTANNMSDDAVERVLRVAAKQLRTTKDEDLCEWSAALVHVLEQRRNVWRRPAVYALVRRLRWQRGHLAKVLGWRLRRLSLTLGSDKKLDPRPVLSELRAMLGGASEQKRKHVAEFLRWLDWVPEELSDGLTTAAFRSKDPETLDLLISVVEGIDRFSMDVPPGVTERRDRLSVSRFQRFFGRVLKFRTGNYKADAELHKRVLCFFSLRRWKDDEKPVYVAMLIAFVKTRYAPRAKFNGVWHDRNISESAVRAVCQLGGFADEVITCCKWLTKRAHCARDGKKAAKWHLKDAG